MIKKYIIFYYAAFTIKKHPKAISKTNWLQILIKKIEMIK